MKYHLLFFLWLAVIFIESSFPAETYPDVDIFAADKIVHIGVYGILGFLCYLSLIHQDKFKFFKLHPFIFTVIISSLYGASDEIHQLFVPNRDGQIWDWAADLAGVVIAVLMVRYYLRKRYKMFSLQTFKSN